MVTRLNADSTCLLLYFFWMARRPRLCPAGTCFHVINRAVARLMFFKIQEDYEADSLLGLPDEFY